MTKFSGKIVIVTGASSGIGAATALAFAEEGAKLTITGRNQERLENTAKECGKKEGCEVLQIISDLSNFDNLKPVIDKTVERFGGIDVLVNNAGMCKMRTTSEITLEEYHDLMNLNLRAAVFLSKFALPHLKESKGCVLNVSSGMSNFAKGNYAVHCMTKFTLDYFTRAFAAECAAFGVRVNAINPGVVLTNIFASSGLSLENFLSEQPFGPIKPEELAKVMLFIASSDHMTGNCLLYDGGMVLPTESK